MGKPEHRLAALRRGLRYPSDMTDSEWTRIAPLIPPARRGGRPRDVNPCEVLNAIFYGLATGCQGQALPKRPPATVRILVGCLASFLDITSLIIFRNGLSSHRMKPIFKKRSISVVPRRLTSLSNKRYSRLSMV